LPALFTLFFIAMDTWILVAVLWIPRCTKRLKETSMLSWYSLANCFDSLRINFDSISVIKLSPWKRNVVLDNSNTLICGHF
jgi:hypothetical protein